MVSDLIGGYRRSDPDGTLRVVVIMPKNEADAIDGWGIPAGMPSRTSAVRFLLRKGLEAVAQDHSGAQQLSGGAKASQAINPATLLSTRVTGERHTTEEQRSANSAAA